MNIKAIIQSIRVPFLLLTPVCILLAASVVIAQDNPVNYSHLALALLGALLAHISVNMLNEFFDFKSGLDLKTKRTNFSGGSGAIPGNPEIAQTVLFIGSASLLGVIAIGFYFVYQFGMGLLPLGLLGVLIIVAYTGFINRYPLLCLIAPGMGFGVLMVIGTQYILLGTYEPGLWIVALVPFFLVNNLLLLNQYPDIEADASVGRRHFPISYGISASNFIYAVFTLLTVMVIVMAVIAGQFPILSLVALLPLLFAFYALAGVYRHGNSIGDYPQYLGANVLASLLTPLFLALSVILG